MKNNLRIAFGKTVRMIRISKGISQEQLSFLCGLHRTYISDIERGTRNVSIDNIEKIAEALDVQPKELLDFSTSQNNEVDYGGLQNENR